MPIPSPRRGLPAILAALLVFFLARPAHAGIELEVGSILGDVRAEGELLVRVRNTEQHEVRGVVTIEDRTPEARVVARAPFVVGAVSTSFVKIPVTSNYGIDVTAIARDGARKELGRASTSSRSNGGYTFLEIPSKDKDERLLPFHVDERRTGGVTITTSPLDEATGASILPDRPTAYGAVALVLVSASELEALDATERDVLLTWVKSGGALAIGVRGPADLARPTLIGLVGAGLHPSPFARIPPTQPNPQSPDDVDPVPGPGVEAKLTGYAGGRLRPSLLGATAELGLGNVHLLAIDPWSKEANGDRWVQAQIVALAREPSRSMLEHPRYYSGSILGILDANDSFRPALAIAALLLLAYAGGVIAIRRLAKRGSVLAPYRWTMAASATTFGAIVVIGLVAKGGTGSRARQLALVEVASGEPVAVERSFRSFYTSRATVIDVAASAPRSTFTDASVRGSLIATSAAGVSTLEHVTIRPWETMVVREDAAITLGQGISVDDQGNVTNRSGLTLRDAILSSVELGCLRLGTIADGATVRAIDGARLEPTICADDAKLPRAWRAFQSAFAGRASLGRPTLLGELERPGVATDTGFRVERHTVLVRVVGGAS